MTYRFACCTIALLCAAGSGAETLAEIGARLGAESVAAYEASPYAAFSKDYFARFSVDPSVKPSANDTVLDNSWAIAVAPTEPELTHTMATHLAEFLTHMNVVAPVVNEFAPDAERLIVLESKNGGKPGSEESFTISATPTRITVRGIDEPGLRDAVVKLVERIGLRQAPMLPQGDQVYEPRLRVRLGVTPWLGTQRDLVFTGYNATFVSGGDFYDSSTSDAIPELKSRQREGALEALNKSVESSKKYRLKSYCIMGTRQKFDKDDPIFQRDPSLRGALTWSADGQYVLCTEHPDMKRYLAETMGGIFKAAPDLDGVAIIIGGESFYHCFMRAYGVEKGHTNCPRCEPLGAEQVVANLCNTLAEAARQYNPNAEIIAWPYSAEHVWSADKAQAGFIKLLKPGCAIFTEMEKDEYVDKGQGVKKHLWDYSIDLIGPGERAKAQIAACRAAGIPIYMKSEPELGFEAPRLPGIPCMDRWLDRADALASCGADGAWVFPAFRPNYGTSPNESYKLVWWTPHDSKEELLNAFASRIAGPKAGPRLRAAWKHVSDAIPLMPEIPSYYNGPYYLGPAHPMCVDPEATLPQVFYGKYLFLAEMSDKEGLPDRPTFVTKPTGNVPVFAKFYREMEVILANAEKEIDTATPDVPERCALAFASEASAIRWFHATVRTEANFYESCILRDRLLALAGKSDVTPEQRAEAAKDLARWRTVLEDELANAIAAIPLVQGDVRLDFYYGGDHTFPHAEAMLNEKIAILKSELADFLPGIARKLTLPPTG